MIGRGKRLDDDGRHILIFRGVVILGIVCDGGGANEQLWSLRDR